MKVKDAPAKFKAVKKEKKSNQPTLYMTKIQICNFSFGYSLTTTAKKKSYMFSAEGKTSERHLIQTEIESGVVEAAENESLIVSHQREKRLL